MVNLTNDSPARRSLESLCKPAPPQVDIRQLAKRLGVTPQAIRNWMMGIRVPGPRHRKQLEKLLGIPESHWELLRESRAA